MTYTVYDVARICMQLVGDDTPCNYNCMDELIDGWCNENCGKCSPEDCWMHAIEEKWPEKTYEKWLEVGNELSE